MDDLLLTFAEIAVAFVGFASIAAVLARQHAGLRLQMLLIYSALPLFLSLLTAAALRSDIPERVVWRSAGGTLAVATAVAAVGPIRRLSRSLRQAGIPHSWYGPLLIGLQLGPIVFCAAGALGAWPAKLPMIVAFSLVALLLLSAIVFARLVLALLVNPPRLTEATAVEQKWWQHDLIGAGIIGVGLLSVVALILVSG